MIKKINGYIIDYDKEHDIFYILKKKREKDVVHSVDLEDFVVDLDKENHVVGVEIIGMSKMLNIPKKYFDNLKNAKLIVSYRRGRQIIAIYLLLQFKAGSKIQEIKQALYFGNPSKIAID